MWPIDPSTVPNPQPGAVLLFLNLAGVLSHKTATGEVVPGVPAAGPQGEQGPQGVQGEAGPQGAQGPAGPQASPVLSAMEVGAYALLGCFIANLAIGTDVVSDGQNLFLQQNTSSTAVPLAAGQVWRWMGGRGANASPGYYLFQRVA